MTVCAFAVFRLLETRASNLWRACQYLSHVTHGRDTAHTLRRLQYEQAMAVRCLGAGC